MWVLSSAPDLRGESGGFEIRSYEKTLQGLALAGCQGACNFKTSWGPRATSPVCHWVWDASRFVSFPFGAPSYRGFCPWCPNARTSSAHLARPDRYLSQRVYFCGASRVDSATRWEGGGQECPPHTCANAKKTWT